MCSLVDQIVRGFALGALLLGVASCFDDHPCGSEVCDGKDNDCDDRTDEDFRTNGLFVDTENCGSCGVDCSEVFPSAARTACVLSKGEPRCEIAACAAGDVLAGTGACVPEVPVLCLPCSSDDECGLRAEGALCEPDAIGGGHCGRGCESPADCPTGYRCTELAEGGRAQCRPNSGACQCDEAMEGAELACELRHEESGRRCAGIQRCLGSELSVCEPALEERCNESDDDCDGAIDESFRDGRGRYIDQDHCGACGRLCAPQGPNMEARCVVDGEEIRCQRGCEPGFVDSDGIEANGCECELRSEGRALIGGDADCDGEIDPTPDLVFVSQAGDDADSGTTPDAPLRSLARGVELGAMLGRSVLVARGVYAGPLDIPAGVTLSAGYSPDFGEHDFDLYPVLLEAPTGSAGVPALRCTDVRVATRIEGLTISASAAEAAGEGSSAVLLDGCGPEVIFEHLTIVAARGGAGRPGADSSARLGPLGFSVLAELDGPSGGPGSPGATPDAGCAPIAAGTGGVKQCPSGPVSGGRGGDARCAALSCDNSSDVPCGNAGCTDFTREGGVCDIGAARAVAVPNPSPAAGSGRGAGAAGAATYDAPTNHRVCTFCDDNPSLPRLGNDGGPGARGVDGAAGLGCSANLELDAEGRLHGLAGGNGASGVDGAGGGGGSAGAGYAKIGNTTGNCASLPGGAGGGGGSGGCAAPGAAGGGGGGGSVGVVIRLALGDREGPTLRDVRIVAASGGEGGDGGIGASGGSGGSGGLGGTTEFWCARSGGRGGDGGPGGAGGGGGGGCGGPSLGIYVLAADGGSVNDVYLDALRSGARVDRAGVAGRGGRGGFSPGASGSAGLEGTAADVLLAR